MIRETAVNSSVFVSLCAIVHSEWLFGLWFGISFLDNSIIIAIVIAVCLTASHWEKII